MRKLVALFLAAALLTVVSGTATALDLTMSQDMGTAANPGLPGSFVPSGIDAYSVTGGGGDIWGTEDRGHFLYHEVLGDGSITAHVAAFTGGGNAWRKGGVMIRDSLHHRSANAFNVVAANNPNNDQYRLSFNAASARSNPRPAGADAVGEAPWVRLTRVGDEFTYAFSPDGFTWTDYDAVQTIPMDRSVYLGLAVTSHANAETTAVDFDNVLISGFTPIETRTWDSGIAGNDWGAAHWEPAGSTVNIASSAILPDDNTDVVTAGAAGGEAHRLLVEGGGISVTGGGTLAITDSATFLPTTTLSISTGSTLTAGGGSIDAITTTGNATIGSTGDDLAVGRLALAAGSTLSTTGTGRLLLDNSQGNGVVANAASTFRLAGGTLVSKGARPLGQSTNLEMAGGALLLRNGVSPGAAPLTAPVSGWDFDDGFGATATNTVDPGGLNDGVLIDFPLGDDHWVDGIVGGALRFDSRIGYVDAGDMDLSAGYTVSTWVKTNSLTQNSQYDSVFTSSGNEGQGNGFQIDVGANIAGNFRWRGGPTIQMGPAINEWTHLAVSYDGATERAYYNGQLVGSAADSGRLFTEFLIGRNRANDWRFSGTVDEMYVYDTALPDADIAAMVTRTAPNMAGTTVTVTADSLIESDADAGLAFGPLVLESGVISTAGRTPISFDGAIISPAATDGRVGFDPQGATDYGGIDANNVKTTITKGGPSTWDLDTAPANLHAEGQWAVEDGTLNLAPDTTPLGGLPVTVTGGTLKAHSLDGSDLTLAGGTFTFTDHLEAGITAPGAVAGWTFDETTGTTAANAITPGTGDGVLTGFPAGDAHWVDGVVGGAIEFNGSDHVQTDYPGIEGSASRSVAFWVKTTDVTDHGIVAWGDSNADGTNGTCD